MKQKFDVTGMTCSACSSRVEKCVSKLAGAEQVSVNLLTNSMQVVYDDSQLSDRQIIDAVTKAGYGASVHQEQMSAPAAGAAAAAVPRENPVEQQMKELFLLCF